MRITEARVIVCSPGRNFVTLKIVTDEGLYGVGDATLNGREMAVAAYLQEHVVPLLIGRGSDRIEHTWQYLFKGSYWGAGPVTMSAIAAVDMALWDLKGKRLGVPVHQLLGGRSRDKVLVYGHANGRDNAETIAAAERYRDLGYRAIRLQAGVPGLEHAYGVGRGDLFYEPAETGSPPEHVWSTETYLDHVPRLFAEAREALGWDVHLLHDAHHRLTPTEAGWLGHRLEDYRLFWLEDPVNDLLQDGFRHLRRHTRTPIAVGEVFNSVFQLHQLVTEQLVDYLRTTVLRTGGITPLMKIAHLAEPYQVRLGSHGATDLSPITMAAALQVDLAVHNFGIQEYMRHSDATAEVFSSSYAFDDGYLVPGAEPGLGADIDEAAAARFPYERAYLPVARSVDGTVTSW
ncbi:D-mannonate dehydratase ManD [Nitriliruptor alkaliphilus]|uniref:D-mannonate dehydratase ManD n=1 Tax=Nitriliruptor alkaliphilus TaxID=427918 RepID=UPI000695A918|nr:D-mannonate dehydratase ManD [Nitriliruptor alkaliphilus]